MSLLTKLMKQVYQELESKGRQMSTEDTLYLIDIHSLHLVMNPNAVVNEFYADLNCILHYYLNRKVDMSKLPTKTQNIFDPARVSGHEFTEKSLTAFKTNRLGFYIDYMKPSLDMYNEMVKPTY